MNRDIDITVIDNGFVLSGQIVSDVDLEEYEFLQSDEAMSFSFKRIYVKNIDELARLLRKLFE